MNQLKKRKNLRYGYGFTLLEMLIAIMIFAIMTSFIYFTLVTSENGARSTLKSSVSYKEAQVVFRTLHDKLLQFNPIESAFIGGIDDIDGKHFSSLYFTGFSHVSVPFNAKSSVEDLNYFHVVPEKGKKYYMLVYRESFFKSVDGEVTRQLRRIVIARNIEYFSAKYLSFSSGLWSDKYNYSKYLAQPAAIKISLGINTGNRVKKFAYRFNM